MNEKRIVLSAAEPTPIFSWSSQTPGSDPGVRSPPHYNMNKGKGMKMRIKKRREYPDEDESKSEDESEYEDAYADCGHE